MEMKKAIGKCKKGVGDGKSAGEMVGGFVG
jgi:hypothetical protein